MNSTPHIVALHIQSQTAVPMFVKVKERAHVRSDSLTSGPRMRLSLRVRAIHEGVLRPYVWTVDVTCLPDPSQMSRSEFARIAADAVTSWPGTMLADANGVEAAVRCTAVNVRAMLQRAPWVIEQLVALAREHRPIVV